MYIKNSDYIKDTIVSNKVYFNNLKLHAKLQNIKEFTIYNPTKEIIFNTVDKCDGYSFYLLLFNDGMKFGVTSNLKTRIRHYTSPWCKDIKAIYTIYGRNLKQLSSLVETNMKKYYVKNKIHSLEYINNIDFDIIRLIIRDKFFNMVNNSFNNNSIKNCKMTSY